jgi:hypothetical protein
VFFVALGVETSTRAGRPLPSLAHCRHVQIALQITPACGGEETVSVEQSSEQDHRPGSIRNIS